MVEQNQEREEDKILTYDDFSGDLSGRRHKSVGIGLEEDGWQYNEVKAAIISQSILANKDLGQEEGQMPDAYLVITKNRVYITKPQKDKVGCFQFDSQSVLIDDSETLETNVTMALDGPQLQGIDKVGLIIPSKSRLEMWNDEDWDKLTVLKPHQMEYNGKEINHYGFMPE